MQFTKSGQEQTPVPRDFPNLLLWLSTEKTFPTGKFKSHSWVKPSYSEVSGRRGPLIQMCVPQPSMISPAMLTLYEIKVLLSVCFRQKFASLPLCKHCMQTRQVQKHLLLFYFIFFLILVLDFGAKVLGGTVANWVLLYKTLMVKSSFFWIDKV